ncbi:MAG: primosomal protein N' [Phycisphaerales bacterium]
MDPGLFPTPDTQPASGSRRVRVVVERGIDILGPGWDGLTYAVPDAWPEVRIGQRVEVPLGRGNKVVQGVVVEAVGATSTPTTAPSSAPSSVWSGELKPVGKVIGTAFPPSLVGLARWIARYYCCPLGMVLGAMVPAAVKRGTGLVRQTVLEQVPDAVLPEKLTPMVRKAWDALIALPPGALPLPARDLARRLELPSVAAINRLVGLGVLRETVREGVRARGWEAPSGDGPPEKPPELTPAQSRAVDAITATLGRFQPHVLLGVTGSGKTEVYLRALEQVIARGESAVVLVPEISLTPQTAGRFLARFSSVGVAVLHSGLTASQRHEQWNRVARGHARVVVGARSAVFAPFSHRDDATEPRAASVSEGSVEHRSDSKPSDALADARGSLALPGGVYPLGLIIVDEEHDHSYKQEQAPRYHARDVALRRAQLAGCPVVLGSATPSLESWHNTRPGDARADHAVARFNLVELTERVGGGRLPRVEIVDLVEERRARTGPDSRLLHSIGPKLEHAIAHTLGEGGQVILLLNRRGYASYICCPDHRCGWLLTCRYCDVTMVFHRGRHAGTEARRHEVTEASDPSSLRASVPSCLPTPLCLCHHCQAEQLLPAQCPVCAKRVNTFGFGTQRLEEELARKFPRLVEGQTMLRLDSDTMTRAQDYFEALERFRTGEVRVLLGTQMISKGLDFPNVRLVGVINADAALNLPDFRAGERTFQLVAQVAGRAGRGLRDGPGLDRVIVQTFSPREPCIVAAAAHNYRAFADRELALRRGVGLPPVGRMARVVCRDEDAAKAEASAGVIADALRTAVERAPVESSGNVRVKGPMPCPISRVAGYYRFAVELLAPGARQVQEALTALRNQSLLKSDDHTAVDVDPVSLL